MEADKEGRRQRGADLADSAILGLANGESRPKDMQAGPRSSEHFHVDLFD